MLFHNGVMPALVENGDDRQVYDFTTDKSECRLFIKYRANKQDTKKPDYSSWLFAIADDKAELQKYIDEGKNLLLASVCGSSELDKSQLVIFDRITSYNVCYTKLLRDAEEISSTVSFSIRNNGT